MSLASVPTAKSKSDEKKDSAKHSTSCFSKFGGSKTRDEEEDGGGGGDGCGGAAAAAAARQTCIKISESMKKRVEAMSFARALLRLLDLLALVGGISIVKRLRTSSGRV